VDKIKGQIWIENFFRVSGINKKELSKTFSPPRNSSKTISNWLNGLNRPSDKSVDKIETIYKGSSTIFYLPVFKLLELEITRETLSHIYSSFESKSFSNHWQFTDLYDDEYHESLDEIVLIEKYHADFLFQLGGIHGFTGILWNLRNAELGNNQDLYNHYVRYAYKSLPSFCRNKAFISHWKEILSLLRTIHRKNYYSYIRIKPIKTLLAEQIHSKHLVTVTSERPTQIDDLRPLPLPSPYEEPLF